MLRKSTSAPPELYAVPPSRAQRPTQARPTQARPTQARSGGRRACFLTDAQGTIQSWSSGAESLLGFTASAVVGQSCVCVFGQGDSARRRLFRVQAAARRDGSIERVSWRLRQDGSRVRLRVSVAPLTDASGAVSGYVHTFESLPAAGAGAKTREGARTFAMPPLSTAADAASSAASSREGRARREARERQRGAVLTRIGAVVAEHADASDLPDVVARMLAPGLAEWCIFALVEADGQLRLCPSEQSQAMETMLATMPKRMPSLQLPLASGPVSRVLRSKRTLLINRLTRAHLHRGSQNESTYLRLVALGASSVLCVPVLAQGTQGDVLGCLLLIGHGTRRFGVRDVALVEDVARQCALALARQRLAEELRAVRAEARATVAYLEALIDAHPGVVLIYDANGRPRRINTLGAQLLGFAAGIETLPTVPVEGGEERGVCHMTEYVGAHAPDVASPITPMLPLLAEALRGGRTDGCRVALRTAAGSERQVTACTAPVYGEDGAILGAVLLADDASTLDRLERQRDAFLSVASHELKTPLTSIKLLAQMTTRQLARLGLPVPPQASHMEHAITRMERLVNDVLDSSRTGADQIELHRDVCDLGSLCAASVAEMIDATEREIALTLPAEPIVVFADPERLCQVLMNLLMNAAKYSPAGRPIAVEVWRDGDEARVTVRDEGAGIASDAMEHLFERFYRVPGIEVQNGSLVGFGLGLYLSREILTRHGGRIWAESTPGQGSAFTFALPVMEGAAPTPLRPTHAREAL